MLLTEFRRRRAVSDRPLAYAVWRVGARVRAVKVSQDAYNRFVASGAHPADAPGRPHHAAQFLLASGGLVGLDTRTGWPEAGDCWEDVRGLVCAVGSDPSWGYEHAVASDPGDGQVSALRGLRAHHTSQFVYGQRPIDRPCTALRWIRGAVPNHHSVTFDATASALNQTGASVTVAGTITSNANSYVAAGAVFTLFGVTLNSVAWNSVNLTKQLNSGPDANSEVDYWDLTSPASGAQSMVFTFSASGSADVGWISAYGVDQGTVRSATNTNAGTSTAPTITITSAVGELVVTMGGARGTGTNTVDATWTSDWVNTGTTDPQGSGAHTAGAASVTRTDTLDTSRGWALVGASLKAAANPAMPQMRSHYLKPRPFAPC